MNNGFQDFTLIINQVGILSQDIIIKGLFTFRGIKKTFFFFNKMKKKPNKYSSLYIQ